MRIKKIVILLLTVIMSIATPIIGHAADEEAQQDRGIAIVYCTLVKDGVKGKITTSATFDTTVTEIEITQYIQHKVGASWIPVNYFVNTVYDYHASVTNTKTKLTSGDQYRGYTIVKAYKGSTLSGTYTAYSSIVTG